MLWQWILSFFQDKHSEEEISITLQHFLAGETIPMLSAILLPTIGGPELIAMQRTIEADIRQHIARQSDMIDQQDQIIRQQEHTINQLEGIISQMQAQAH